METPETRYAKTIDGVNIAYQVRGDGPIDLVYIIGMTGNFEIEFEPPWGVRLLERLSSFSRVILFDKRGTGLSDRSGSSPLRRLPWAPIPRTEHPPRGWSDRSDGVGHPRSFQGVRVRLPS